MEPDSHKELRGPVEAELPPEFVKQLREIKGQRSEVVIQHILKYGYITTTTLKEKYGYIQPPRAARDVKERGIELEAVTVMEGGKRVALYRLPQEARNWSGRLGRRNIPKSFKDDLVKRYGPRCNGCGGANDPRDLQVDHRVPFEIAGESVTLDPEEFQLLCRSCNRTKSWTCEQECPNWKVRAPTTCMSCFWHDPTKYQHLATIARRRLQLEWSGAEVGAHDRLVRMAAAAGKRVEDLAKDLLGRHRE